MERTGVTIQSIFAKIALVGKRKNESKFKLVFKELCEDLFGRGCDSPQLQIQFWIQKQAQAINFDGLGLFF